MPDKCIDLVLTDPPYGIRVINANYQNKTTKRGQSKAHKRNYELSSWDDTIPSKEIFEQIIRVSKNQIIFGGNYFVEYLKNSSCWLVWDKDNGENFFADCELAWTSFNTAVRKFKFKWNGMLQEYMGRGKEERFHPTQKPIELMSWILQNYSEEGMTILDPFLGSGTTALACKKLKRNYIGVEISDYYCKVADERLRQDILL